MKGAIASRRVGAGLVAGVVGCALLGGADTGAAAPSACRGDSATGAFVAPGPHGVGVRTLTFLDASRDTPAHGPVAARPGRELVTEVWYPTAGPAGATPARDAAAAPGRFPLIVDGHGFGDVRDSRAYYAEALASRGYVVAAPDFPVTNGLSGAPRNLDTPNQPGDVSFLITALLDLARDRGSWLAGRLGRRRVAVSGYSNGGTTALLAGFHPTLRDDRVRAVAVIAPGACYLREPFFDHARLPLLVIEGESDAIVGGDPRKVFRLAHAGRTLVSFIGGTHAAALGFVTYPSARSYDGLVCAVLNGLPPDAFVLDPDELGGAGAGIDPADCAAPCQGPLPAGRPMQALRQHDLTTAAITAFFDATLRRSRRARCFLERGLAGENTDVRVERAARSPLPLP